MKIIYKLLSLLSIILFYYLSNPNNYFMFLVIINLSLIFNNILNNISLNKDKSNFKDTILSIIFLNIIFLIITIAIAFILTKIFYLHNSIPILLLLSLTYSIIPIINIQCEYLKLNHYKKLGNFILKYYSLLNILIFNLNSYLSLKVLNLNTNNSLIIIISIYLTINYLLIYLIFNFIKKKIPKPKISTNNKFKLSLNLSKILIKNYPHILGYISLVYLFYLLINRYYYSYQSTSTLITNYYLYSYTLIYIIITVIKPLKNNLISLTISIMGILLINTLTPAIITPNDSYILTLLFIELFFITIYHKTISKPSKKLTISLIISIFIKLTLTLPLIEKIYLTSHNPIIGNTISNIICYLIIIIINIKIKPYLEKNTTPKLIES